MTTYHVWLVDQVEPEIVRAVDVIAPETDGWLCFVDSISLRDDEETGHIGRSFAPHEWRQWAVVHDEADTVHL